MGSGEVVNPNPGGTELGYAEITANAAADTSTTMTAITGLSTTVNVGTRPVKIEVCAEQVINNNATLSVAQFGIFRDGVQIMQAALTLGASAQFGGIPLYFKKRDAPAAGSHTYEVRQAVQATGMGTSLLASATAPASIQVTEC